MRTVNTQKQKGQVFLIVAISLVVLLASLGLAMDTGMAYMTKAKLNAAVDSAVVAAATAVTQGTTQAEQTANATQAARNFFNANYPAGYLGTTVNFPDPTIVFNGGQVTIDASASAAVPVTLMHLMNFKFLNVAAAAQTLRKDLDLAFVVDTTGSITNNPGDPALVRTNAKLFLTKFNALQDRVALLQFCFGTVVRDPFSPTSARGFDIKKMDTDIDNFVFGGNTNSSEAVWNARDQLNNVIDPTKRSSLRVIVFFSDGAPNSFASDFPMKSGGTCTGTIATGDDRFVDQVTGLYSDNQINAQLPGNCWKNTGIPGNVTFPAWYNAHNPTDIPALREFPVLTALPRPVTNNMSNPTIAWQNVNRASRNLLEAVSAKARSEGIYVFTLGLGQLLTTQQGPDGEVGENVLKCMANTGDALPRCVTAGAGQPVGIYCHAVDATALAPCFDKLASAILRITK